MRIPTKQALWQQALAASTIIKPSIAAGRFFSTSPVRAETKSASTSMPTPTPTKPHTIDPKWLTLTKRRIGRCMMFGLKPPQIQEAGDVLQQIARDWRELVSGSEGFLTNEIVRGLFQHNVAWGEMDTMGHVNNVMYVRYAETARVNFMRNFATHMDPANKKAWMNLVGSTGIGLILRSIKIDYKFPMKYPDKISVYHKLVQDPSSQADKSAFELQVVILSEAHQRPAARCHEDIVTYNYREAKKTPMPPFMMEQFQRAWALQEEAKKTWQQRILGIEGRVRTLETESWDREDAVEDTGSAKK
ncbi:thioesterase family protein [Aspergillus glaucus CBS 516.65]|uniref:Thioesterase domain-containing protein n=1 Tax=Aspergillus glaucus CBS 516.65 TaxID=1160497 RepID=A0A1L9VDV2_ASPGL|nr:hypothetical protein ASPGLDRAFT_49478 [Aspergillus glaucus CBS 516.65]OJJ82084.1 hypothetical protein ASPGLDRAFT_49478 [Aspergillus glaucus CBS 516.65]